MVKFKEVTYKGLKDCVKLSNDFAELIIPTQLGIRVLSYRRNGGENVMKVFDGQIKTKDKNEWQSFGGHRLWHAPEEFPRTYEIDGAGLPGWEWTGRDGKELILDQEPDKLSGIKKRVTVRLDDNSSKVFISHKLTNLNAWEIEVSAWALTVLREGGFCAFRIPDNYNALLPNWNIALWPYTKINDKRLYCGDKIISVRQFADAKIPFKLGVFAPYGSAAYFVGRDVFKKTFGCGAAARQYPDFGCNFECYTNADMLECESLSPLTKLRCGESIVWDETWSLEELPKEINYDNENEILKILE